MEIRGFKVGWDDLKKIDNNGCYNKHIKINSGKKQNCETIPRLIISFLSLSVSAGFINFQIWCKITGIDPSNPQIEETLFLSKSLLRAYINHTISFIHIKEIIFGQITKLVKLKIDMTNKHISNGCVIPLNAMQRKLFIIHFLSASSLISRTARLNSPRAFLMLAQPQAAFPGRVLLMTKPGLSIILMYYIKHSNSPLQYTL